MTMTWARWREWYLPGTVFVVGLLVTAVAGVRHENRARQDRQQQALNQARSYTVAMQQALDRCVAFNQGLAAHAAGAEGSSRRGFEEYIRRAHDQPHWGRHSVGYVARVPAEQIAAFEQAAQEDYPGFRAARGLTGGGEIHPLLHLHPGDSPQRALRGRDQAVIPARRDALQAAADGRTTATVAHRSPVLTGRVIMVFSPVYELSASLATPQERQAALKGFVFSTLSPGEVVKAALGEQRTLPLDIELYDHTSGAFEPLFDADGTPHAYEEAGPPLVARTWIDFGGRRWEAQFYRVGEQAVIGAGTWLLLASGVLASAVLSLLIGLARRWARRGYTHDALAANLHRAFKHHPSAVYYLDTQRRFVNANDKARAEFGLGREELKGRPSQDLIAPEMRDVGREQWQQAAVHGRAVSYDTIIVTRDGTRADVHMVLVPMISDGHVAGVLGMVKNISEDKRRAAEVRASRQMLQSIVDHLPQHVFWKDESLRYMGCNRRFAQYLGVERTEDLIGCTDHDLWRDDSHIDAEHLELYRDEDLAILRGTSPALDNQVQGRHPDGREFWARTQKVPLFDDEGQVVGVLGVSEDITERKQLELRLEQMAHYDSLTGLTNRAFFLAQLEQAVHRSRRNGSRLAVLYFDIDRFKSINDTWGHDVGDLAIKEFAARVSQEVRAADTLGRLGGDEFVMVSEGLASDEDARLLAQRLVGRIREPFRLRADLVLQVSTSIGIAWLEEGVDAEEILRRADQAMFEAKRAGRDCIRVHGERMDVAKTPEQA